MAVLGVSRALAAGAEAVSLEALGAAGAAVATLCPVVTLVPFDTCAGATAGEGGEALVIAVCALPALGPVSVLIRAILSSL